MAGDPVCRGDAIETAAGARIGIRFIDGTVFNLSAGTRVVLDEFICDPGGLPQSAGLAVTRGSFAFMPGEAARTGALRIDTPVGSIRGRAAGGFGMLSLTALTFALLNEAQAADPNVTLLDDDSITYKDFEHGSFELVTKELNPRHIIVDDPGQTIVLTRKGSSVSVDQFTNSAARMAELHAAQRDLLANLENEMNNGSSTPPSVGAPAPQRINFIESDQIEQQSLPAIVFPTFDFIPIKLPPSLFAPAGPTEIDTVVFDAFTATSGTFHATSTNAGTLVFGISGGTGGTTVLDGVTYDVSEGSPYGTLYLNSASGAYTFVPDSDAINALKSPTSDSFVITVSDGTLSTSQTFTIAINGVNDAAHISGTATGSATEASDAAHAAVGATASGRLTDTDVDDPANTFTLVSSKASAGGYGTFAVTADGVWTYTLDNTNRAVQALNAGDTLTDTFTVTTIDGTPQLVTITIHGANDAAIVSGTTAGAVTEAGGVANGLPGTPTVSGTLTDTDLDNAANSFTAVNTPTASAGGYGSFTMTAAGVWIYTLDNTNSAVQALNAGGTLTDSFTVTTIDSTPQLVTVTIHGSNDAAIISGSTAGAVLEAGGVANAVQGTPIVSGTLTDTDVDNAANSFAAVTTPTVSAAGYGTFTISAGGVWTYALDNSDSAVQALNVGDTLIDSFTVTTIDGTAQVVTITINGSNDAAIISGVATGSVTEAGGISRGIPVATGTLTDTDLDNTANSFAAVGTATRSDGGYGTFTMTAAGIWTFTLDNANPVVDALNVGDTLTDTFTVHTADGTAQVVTIAIHGASDADPNDFDNLATGSVVVVDPPLVHGTPGHDSIAGGGSVTQIIYGGAGDDTINGTGVDDVLYGGSGNDTIKGNGGNDAIYGGSGSDTISGSNGDDTIIGGFGADLLTGSNGNDTFVYLSAVDSHAGQFDTITDFGLGSDRIDLTALGALAFMALSSTNTTVPPHTIAWRYDGASNETIVYVNPTDQALNVGDSNLVEIHLQGIVSVQASDFVTDQSAAPIVAAADPLDLALAATAENLVALATTTTTDASSDSTGGTLAADGIWSAETTGTQFSFDAAQESLGATGLTSSGSSTQATELFDAEALTAPESAPTVVPHGVHTVTHDNFTFDQATDSSTLKTTGDVAAVPPSGLTATTIVIVPISTVESENHGATPEHGGGNGHSHTQAETESVAALDQKDQPSNHQQQDHSGPKGHAESPQSNPANAGAVETADTHDNSPHDNGAHGNGAGNGAKATDTADLGDTFHFKDNMPNPKHSDPVDVADITPAPADHHDDGVAHQDTTVAETPTDDLSLHSHHAAGHGHVNHATHDLIV
ncbi:VCBS domain-containing protein [Bradyrhizobium jicamae]|nr:VCBS domain-containing protein [Bradyrhizobium jicamae]MBR0756698.1 VCBS domain-containing protein [Bradyrhizobium jicamae]